LAGELKIFGLTLGLFPAGGSAQGQELWACKDLSAVDMPDLRQCHQP